MIKSKARIFYKEKIMLHIEHIESHRAVYYTSFLYVSLTLSCPAAATRMRSRVDIGDTAAGEVIRAVLSQDS